MPELRQNTIFETNGVPTEERAAIAFKKLLGLANTKTYDFAFYNESIPSQISMHADNVLSETIPDNPQTAIDNGKIEYINADLVEIPGTDGFSANIVFPDTSNSVGGSLGQPIREKTQIVNKKFNVTPIDSNNFSSGGYGYNLFDSNGDQISLTDDRNWQVDPVAGIVKTDETESTVSLGGGSVEIFIYTGQTLREELDTLASSTGDVQIEDDGSLLLSGDGVEKINFGTNLDVTNPTGNDVKVDGPTSEDIQDAAWNIVSTQVALSNADQSLINLVYSDSTDEVLPEIESDLSQYDNTVSEFLDSGGIDDLIDAGTLLGKVKSPVGSSNPDKITFNVDKDLSNYDNTNSGFISGLSDQTTNDLNEPGSKTVPLNYSDDNDDHVYFTKQRVWDSLVEGGDITFTEDVNGSGQMKISLNQYSSFDSDFDSKNTNDLSEPDYSNSVDTKTIPQTYQDVIDGTADSLYLTKERVQDVTNETLSAGSGIQIEYQDSNDKILIKQDSDVGGGINVYNGGTTGGTDVLGTTELEFGTDIQVTYDSSNDRAVVNFVGSAGSSMTIQDSAGTTSYNGSLLEASDDADATGITQIDFNDQLDVVENGDTVVVNSLVPTEDIDTRLSEVERLLPSAPDLSTIDSGTYQTGKVSFGSSNSISGVNNPSDINEDSNINADVGSQVNNKIVDEGGTVTGTLNFDVQGSDSDNSGGDDAFGSATEGELRLVLNGSVVHTVDLSTTSSFSSTTGSTGFTLGEAKKVTFPDGSEFNSYWRTSSYQVDRQNSNSNPDLEPGWNKVKVQHYDDSNNLIGETNKKYFVKDNESSTPSFKALDGSGSTSSNSITNLSFGSTKYLSGIEYYTSFSTTFQFTFTNVYLYTYSHRNNAVSLNLKNSVSDSGPNYQLNDPPNNNETSDASIPAVNDGNGPESLSGGSGTSVKMLKGQEIGGSVDLYDPTDFNGGSNNFNITNRYDILVDGKSGGNTSLKNVFDSEGRRYNGGQDFSDPNVSATWNSQADLTGGNSNYNDGLQIDIYPSSDIHRLVYPNFDYTTINDAPANFDYSDASGIRYYWGVFDEQDGSLPAKNFNFVIKGDGFIIEEGENLDASSKDIKVAIRLPGQTGWMDAKSPFDSSYGNVNHSGGKNLNGEQTSIDGAASGSSNTYDFTNNSGPADFTVTTGDKASDNSNNKIYYRIKASADWQGHINSIEVK